MLFPGLAPVCKKYSVKHMLTRKATSRTIRWHFFAYGALNTILVANAYNVHEPESPDDNDEDQHIIIVCQSFKCQCLVL